MRRSLGHVRLATAIAALAACEPPTQEPADAAIPVDARAPPTAELDLLFMIDDSGSMNEEQATLESSIPQLMELLATGHDVSGFVPDHTPFDSIHLAVITSDLGVGTSEISTCDAVGGDDGILQIDARHPLPSCDTSYLDDYGARFFDWEREGPRNVEQVAHDLSCVMSLGTAGCGFEQQLDAPLEALSPAPRSDGGSPFDWTAAGYVPPVFRGGLYGHGNDPATNGGFLRPDSVLAIVLLSDEDDCSTDMGARLYSLTDPEIAVTDLNLRCHAYPEMQYPLSRFVDGFIGLRREPQRLVFAAITGVPPESAGMPPSTLLALPAMHETLDPQNPTRLLPVCVSPGGRGVAYPARRIVGVAEALEARGAHVTVQTICATDFFAQLAEITGEIFLASE